MKLVIDTNIIFSSFLRSDSHELAIIKSGKHDLYYCQFTTIEIFKHKEKVVKRSGLTETEILEAYGTVLRRAKMVHDDEIPESILKRAYGLCKDIDKKDMVFVAAALMLDAFLWTGDKKLKEGLKRKGFTKVLRTSELA